MATKYPDGIDNTTSLPYITNGTSPMVAEDINRLRDAVVAVETELGVDPSGTFTSVGARLQANEQAISEYAQSQFLVLSHDGYISQERVFAPSANFSAVDGGAGFDYTLDLAPVVGIGTLSPATDYSLTLDGNGSSRIGGVVLRNAGADSLFIGNPSAGNALDVEIRNPNSGYLNIESAGEIAVQGAAVAIDSVGAVDIQGASATLDTTGSLSIGATSSGVEIGKAGADTEVLGDLSVDESINVPNGTITFSSDLSIGSYPAGYTGFGPPLPLPYSVLNSTSGIIANTQGEELLLTTNLSGIFGLNTDNWTLLGLDNGRTVATNKYGGVGGPTSPATMFSTQAAFGVVGTMVLGSADPDDGDGAAIEAGENLAITALGGTALLLANNSSGTATIKVGAIDGSGPTGTDSWDTKYGDSSLHVAKIVDFVHNGFAQVQVAAGGGEAAPEYSFSGATNTGVFQGAPGSLSISADGLEVLRAINASSAREVVIGPDEEDSSLDSVLMATSRPSGGTADSDGSSLYLRAGTGLGTGDGGSIVMQVAPSAALSGQSQNTFSDILTADAGSVASPRQLVIDASAVTIGGPTANNAIVDIGAQESASGITKQINIGNGGLSGSTTDINIGSAVVGTSNITIGDLNANVEINGSSIVASGLTASTTMSLFNQATIATRTKTITIGNGALSGSTTNINIGSSVAGASNIAIGDSDATTSMSGSSVTVSGTTASSSALSLFNQASASSFTKTINIGNGGLAGSTTNVNMVTNTSSANTLNIGTGALSTSQINIGTSSSLASVKIDGRVDVPTRLRLGPLASDPLEPLLSVGHPSNIGPMTHVFSSFYSSDDESVRLYTSARDIEIDNNAVVQLAVGANSTASDFSWDFDIPDTSPDISSRSALRLYMTSGSMRLDCHLNGDGYPWADNAWARSIFQADYVKFTLGTGVVFNPDGGIGRHTSGALSIGSDAQVTGINIGTSSNTGNINIGHSGISSINLNALGTSTLGEITARGFSAEYPASAAPYFSVLDASYEDTGGSNTGVRSTYNVKSQTTTTSTNVALVAFYADQGYSSVVDFEVIAHVDSTTNPNLSVGDIAIWKGYFTVKWKSISVSPTISALTFILSDKSGVTGWNDPVAVDITGSGTTRIINLRVTGPALSTVRYVSRTDVLSLAKMA